MADQLHLARATQSAMASWDAMEGTDRRDWSLFFGQSYRYYSQQRVPPSSITSLYPERLATNQAVEFPSDPVRPKTVCPDIVKRQCCRRSPCMCIHPDFIDYSWVPLSGAGTFSGATVTTSTAPTSTRTPSPRRSLRAFGSRSSSGPRPDSTTCMGAIGYSCGGCRHRSSLR